MSKIEDKYLDKATDLNLIAMESGNTYERWSGNQIALLKKAMREVAQDTKAEVAINKHAIESIVELVEDETYPARRNILDYIEMIYDFNPEVTKIINDKLQSNE